MAKKKTQSAKWFKCRTGCNRGFKTGIGRDRHEGWFKRNPEHPKSHAHAGTTSKGLNGTIERLKRIDALEVKLEAERAALASDPGFGRLKSLVSAAA